MEEKLIKRIAPYVFGASFATLTLGLGLVENNIEKEISINDRDYSVEISDMSKGIYPFNDTKYLITSNYKHSKSSFPLRMICEDTGSNGTIDWCSEYQEKRESPLEEITIREIRKSLKGLSPLKKES